MINSWKSLSLHGERKNQCDERKHAKSAKAQRKKTDEEDALIRGSMQKLQEQGDKITRVPESMEKNQAQQLQLMNQFMNSFVQTMQSSKNSQ